LKIRTQLFGRIDWLTIILFLLLVIAGWFNIYSVVNNEDTTSILDFEQKYGRQLIWIICSVLLAFIILIIDSKFYSFFTYFIYGSIIFLLILVIFFGIEMHGSRSWFKIGFFMFQPSEFAKFATSLAIAKYIGSKNLRLTENKPRIIVIIIILFPALLILAQNDLGSAMVFSIFLLVLYRAGLQFKYIIYLIFFIGLFFLSLLIEYIFLIPGLTLFFILRYIYLEKVKKEWIRVISILAYLIILFFGLKILININISYLGVILICIAVWTVFYIVFYRKRTFPKRINIILPLVLAIGFSLSVGYVYNSLLEPYQRQRIDNIIGKSDDPLGSGYNINQSKIAIGSGGFSGKGYLKGTQTKYDFVPEQATDFIFCTVGEEWGFIGSFVIILIFTSFLSRIILIAERQHNSFTRIYGYAIASLLFFHYSVNIAMTLGLFPVIGIPLPFFSYGGSSMIAFTIMLFVFIRFDSERGKVII